jgi:hypothetical protein
MMKVWRGKTAKNVEGTGEGKQLSMVMAGLGDAPKNTVVGVGGWETADNGDGGLGRYD